MYRIDWFKLPCLSFSMEDCALCLTQFDERPTSHLLCHHVFHTQCLFQRIAQNFYRCPTCDTPYLERRQLYEDHDDTYEREAQRVSTLYDTDRKFKKDLQAWKKKAREVSKPHRVFRNYLSVKREQLKLFTEPLERQIREYRRSKIDEIKNSQEFKTLVSKNRAANALLGRFFRTYSMTSLYSLRTKPGFRNLQSYRFRRSPQRLIRKYMRVWVYLR